ncbi:MAG: short-chain dehydrogenase/reductase [Sphingomonadales bacterium]|nr:short-chain dehydrogenase/reductase [Sphingomonadales bacterium]
MSHAARTLQITPNADDGPASLRGGVALVTGAGRGIGRTIAERLAADGATVALVARSADELTQTQEAILAAGGQATCCPLDLTDPSAPAAAVEHTVKEHGSLSIVVNNAGGAHRVRPLAELDEATFALGTELNYTSVYRVMRAAAEHLFAAAPVTGASVLNVVSFGAERAIEGVSYYNGAKAAVVALSRTAAREWGPKGVRVNCLGPGWIDTDLSAPLLAQPEFVTSTLERVPLGRFGRPEDVAGVAAFLVSDAAAYVTGQTLFVDGGLLT